MKEMICIKPKKVVTIMKNFVNNIDEYTYSFYKESCFSVYLYEHPDIWEDGNFRLAYGFEELSELTPFRRVWCPICPMLKGFATITLALLHEVGHVETRKEMHDYTFGKRQDDMKELKENKEILKYFLLPDERAATEWAIEWLKNSENRKIAKKFEKEFFSCFKRG